MCVCTGSECHGTLARLYLGIIHKLQQVDFLTYRWTNMVKLFYTTYTSVDLAHHHHEILRALVGKSGISAFTSVNVGHHNILCNNSGNAPYKDRQYYLFCIYVIGVFPGLV